MAYCIRPARLPRGPGICTTRAELTAGSTAVRDSRATALARLGRVYGVLACGVAWTTAMCVCTGLLVPASALPIWLAGSLFVSLVLSLAIWLTGTSARVSATMLALTCTVDGAVLGPTLRLIERGAPGVTMLAVTTTVAMVGVLTMYVVWSGHRFSHWRAFLCCALAAVLVTGIVGVAMHITWLVQAVCAISVLVFGAAVVVDTSAILEPGHENVVACAFSLYLSVRGLFVSCLELLVRSWHR